MKNVLLIFFAALISILISCSNSEEPVIDCSATDLRVTVDATTPADCDINGSINVTGSGGSGSYSFSADGISFQSGTTLNDLPAGTYNLTIRDTDGCTSSTVAVVPAVEGSVSLTIETTSSSCLESTGAISASASGGVGPYLYSLDGGSDQESGEFINLSAGPHQVRVTDSEDCQTTKDVHVNSDVSLTTTIAPIIAANCAVSGCHNGSRFPDLRSTAAIIDNASRIKSRTSAGTMPPSGEPDLSSDQIALIACWVDDGAPNN